jgi:hypothetical protein
MSDGDAYIHTLLFHDQTTDSINHHPRALATPRLRDRHVESGAIPAPVICCSGRPSRGRRRARRLLRVLDGSGTAASAPVWKTSRTSSSSKKIVGLTPPQHDHRRGRQREAVPSNCAHWDELDLGRARFGDELDLGTSSIARNRRTVHVRPTVYKGPGDRRQCAIGMWWHLESAIMCWLEIRRQTSVALPRLDSNQQQPCCPRASVGLNAF